MFRLEKIFFNSKKDFSSRNAIHRLKLEFLDRKHPFWIEKTTLRLETKFFELATIFFDLFLKSRRNVKDEKKICTLEIKIFDWKLNF